MYLFPGQLCWAYLEETDKTLTYSRVPHRFNQGGGGGGGGKGGWKKRGLGPRNDVLPTCEQRLQFRCVKPEIQHENKTTKILDSSS